MRKVYFDVYTLVSEPGGMVPEPTWNITASEPMIERECKDYELMSTLQDILSNFQEGEKVILVIRTSFPLEASLGYVGGLCLEWYCYNGYYAPETPSGGFKASSSSKRALGKLRSWKIVSTEVRGEPKIADRVSTEPLMKGIRYMIETYDKIFRAPRPKITCCGWNLRLIPM